MSIPAGVTRGSSITEGGLSLLVKCTFLTDEGDRVRASQAGERIGSSEVLERGSIRQILGSGSVIPTRNHPEVLV